MKRAFIRLFGCVLSAIGLSRSYDTTLTVVLDDELGFGGAYAAPTDPILIQYSTGGTGTGLGYSYTEGTCSAVMNKAYVYKYYRLIVPFHQGVLSSGATDDFINNTWYSGWSDAGLNWSGVDWEYVGGTKCARNETEYASGSLIVRVISGYAISGTGNCYLANGIYYSPFISTFTSMGCQYVEATSGLQNWTEGSGSISGTGSGSGAGVNCYYTTGNMASTMTVELIEAELLRCDEENYWDSSTAVSSVARDIYVVDPMWGSSRLGLSNSANIGDISNVACITDQSVTADHPISNSLVNWDDDFCAACPTYAKTSDLTSYTNLVYKSTGGTGISSCKINLNGEDVAGSFRYGTDCAYSQ